MIYALRYDGKKSKIEDRAIQKNYTRWLLTESLRRELGRDPDLKQMRFGSHGKPFLEGVKLSFNLTNCSGLICCAVHKTEVGIDAETIRAYHPRRTRKVCTKAETREIEAAENPAEQFIAFWTLKESLLKYTGDGLGYGPQNAVFSYRGGAPKSLSFPDVQVLQRIEIQNGKKYWISVCTADLFLDEINYLNHS